MQKLAASPEPSIEATKKVTNKVHATNRLLRVAAEMTGSKMAQDVQKPNPEPQPSPAHGPRTISKWYVSTIRMVALSEVTFTVLAKKNARCPITMSGCRRTHLNSW